MPRQGNYCGGCYDDNLPTQTCWRSSGYVVLDSTANYGTIGGRGGHICRRFCHVFMSSLSPLLFFGLPALAESVAGMDAERTPLKIVSIMSAVNLLFELVRLKSGTLHYGQRTYEKNILSAQFWGGMGICLVLLGSPRRPDFQGDLGVFRHRIWIGGPILWSMAIIDPLIGELKSLGFSLKDRSLVGCLFCAIIFATCTIVGLETPWWFCLVYPPIIVFAEFAGGVVRIDDNGLMLIVPLLMTYIFLPWV